MVTSHPFSGLSVQLMWHLNTGNTRGNHWWSLHRMNSDADADNLYKALQTSPGQIKIQKKVAHSGRQNCFCCAAHTRLSSRTLSSSILYVLHHWVIRARGWWMGAERSSSYASSQACMSRTRSPAAINLVPRPLKPASNNSTALQTEEEIRSMKGRGSKRGNQREKRKTSCSRWHQMYLRGSSRGSTERALSRYERLQTGSERRVGRVSARKGWANARGRKGESPLPPLDSTWFMWQL